MSYTTTIKNYLLNECKMDAVGIAPASAFASEAPEHRPEVVLPGAKSVIVFTKRIPNGVVQAAFRRFEDGNEDALSIYGGYGYELTPNMNLFFMQFNLAEYIERSFGYTAMAVPSGTMQNVVPVNKPMPIFVGPTRQDYIVHSERAAFLAGLGDIAWNNMLVTKENGPRQQIGLVVTTMELDYDQPYSGEKLCDPEKCGICTKICPTHAIPAADGESECFDCNGTECKVAHVNASACAVASMGFAKEYAGKAKLEFFDLDENVTEEQLSEAYLKRAFSNYGLDHYPKYFCNKCILYCPLGNWKEKFADTNFSSFDGKEL